MKFSKLREVSIVMATIAALAAQTGPSKAHDHIGGAIAAGIVGLVVGAAVVDSSRPRDTDVYGGQPPAQYGPPPPFSPTPGVSCYPSRRQCFMQNGLLDWTWTDRIFPRY